MEVNRILLNIILITGMKSIGLFQGKIGSKNTYCPPHYRGGWHSRFLVKYRGLDFHYFDGNFCFFTDFQEKNPHMHAEFRLFRLFNLDFLKYRTESRLVAYDALTSSMEWAKFTRKSPLCAQIQFSN